jgi:hypothetical protein
MRIVQIQRLGVKLRTLAGRAAAVTTGRDRREIGALLT